MKRLSSHLRRRPVLVAAALVAVAGLAVCVWWAGRAPAAPEPPAVSLDGVEKPVADAITQARQRVEEEPGSAEAWGYLGKLLLTHRFPGQAEECFVQAGKLDAQQPRWPYYR